MNVKTIYKSLIILTSIIGCQKEPKTLKSNEFIKNVTEDTYNYKKYVAKTLSKAIREDSDLREFLKSEALKRFDHDYDILYQLIKHKSLKNGQKFSDVLFKYTKDSDSLETALNRLPLLTIFIPQLPEEKNAETWDTQTEIPYVAVEPQNGPGSDIFAIDKNGNEFSIPVGLIPMRTTLVVKDNDRVIVTKDNERLMKNNSNKLQTLSTGPVKAANIILNEGDISLSYADQVFDNSSFQTGLDHLNTISSTVIDIGIATGNVNHQNGGDGGRGSNNPGPGYSAPGMKIKPATIQHLVDAFNSGNEWQRDYLYYGISQKDGVTTGPINRKMAEYLTAVRFDHKSRYQTLSQSGLEGKPVDHTTIWQDWTNGDLEFRLTTLINAKVGSGSNDSKTFFVHPRDLFNIRYDRVQRPRTSRAHDQSDGEEFWGAQIHEAKLYVLRNPIKIEAWDLSNVSVGWRVFFSKFNNTTTFEETTENSSEFTTNFEISIPLGDKVKIGPKFGASAKETSKQAFKVIRSVGPADFGSASLHFYDPIIRELPTRKRHIYLTPDWDTERVDYMPNELFLGAVYLTIEPRPWN